MRFVEKPPVVDGREVFSELPTITLQTMGLFDRPPLPHPLEEAAESEVIDPVVERARELAVEAIERGTGVTALGKMLLVQASVARRVTPPVVAEYMDRENKKVSGWGHDVSIVRALRRTL